MFKSRQNKRRQVSVEQQNLVTLFLCRKSIIKYQMLALYMWEKRTKRIGNKVGFTKRIFLRNVLYNISLEINPDFI